MRKRRQQLRSNRLLLNLRVLVICDGTMEQETIYGYQTGMEMDFLQGIYVE
ncbi:hypothetical protein GcM1_c13850o3 [Golovinomyces cichoracearum]|uniref:Uncharacterized protein n=1 Tax=Golovinomyces cichoracearum TaxID=62708 RepID=A0A420IAS6_9PEZI|nr:hypothetical protein GcM1_c13850o3 [Golovinomyces cichoracearum]